MEHPLRADPHQDLSASVGKFCAERDCVVAGVEHEHRNVVGVAGVAEIGHEALHLGDCCGGGVGVR